MAEILPYRSKNVAKTASYGAFRIDAVPYWDVNTLYSQHTAARPRQILPCVIKSVKNLRRGVLYNFVTIGPSRSDIHHFVTMLNAIAVENGLSAASFCPVVQFLPGDPPYAVGNKSRLIDSRRFGLIMFLNCSSH